MTGETVSLNSIPHAALIPVGPYAGWIMLIDFPAAGTDVTWYLLDPEPGGQPGSRTNPGVLLEPAQPSHPGFQELTCAEHGWTNDGRLVLSGGTKWESSGPVSSKEVWIYDPNVFALDPTAPPEGDWFRQPELSDGRWYPSVVVSGVDPDPDPQENPFGELIIGGGWDAPFDQRIPGFPPGSAVVSTYQIFRPGPRHWPPNPNMRGKWRQELVGGQLSIVFPGPPEDPNGGKSSFGLYPRLFVTPSGDYVLAGKGGGPGSVGNVYAMRMTTYPATSVAHWESLDFLVPNLQSGIHYGPVLLYPNLSPSLTNTLLNIAGKGSASSNVEWAEVSQPSGLLWPDGYLWTDENSSVGVDRRPPAMQKPRLNPSAVVLPDASIVVFGGNDSMKPEMLEGGQWLLLGAGDVIRDLHFWALLLPSGRVLVGGGDASAGAGGFESFQIYEPSYVAAPRPSWNEAIPDLDITDPTAQTVTVAASVPPGTTAAKVVLIRASSMTHHADTDTRYVELAVTDVADGYVTFELPDGVPALAPSTPGSGYTGVTLGYYLAFVVTNTNIPSVGQFVLVR